MTTQLISFAGFSIVVETKKTSSMSKYILSFFNCHAKSLKESEDHSIETSKIYATWINKHKKLPKYWSMKEGHLVYSIGTFCFSQENFINDLKLLTENYHSVLISK